MHFSELRDRINAVRASAGLGTCNFTADISVGSPVTAAAVTELRAALNDARTALGVPLLSSDPTIDVNQVILAAHIQAVRNGTRQ